MSSEFILSESGEPQILVGANYLSREDLTNDLRFGVAFALGGIAISGGSAYATIKMIENDVADELLPLAAPGGGLMLGLAMLKGGISTVINSVRNRRALDKFQQTLEMSDQ
jgi:hypothetical protein